MTPVERVGGYTTCDGKGGHTIFCIEAGCVGAGRNAGRQVVVHGDIKRAGHGFTDGIGSSVDHGGGADTERITDIMTGSELGT